MTGEGMVVVDMKGKVIEGYLRPSSDTPTHLELYKAFAEIGGITHTHSLRATAFAQACREIPCLGTTHADSFYGPVPVTRYLTRDEVESAYEVNTGKVIIERFGKPSSSGKMLDPVGMPGILVAGHGPFSWGRDAEDSVRNSLVLEQVAAMALAALNLNPNLKTAAHAWILVGDTHHTSFSQALTPDHMEDFAEMTGMEYLLIDESTRIPDFKKN